MTEFRTAYGPHNASEYGIECGGGRTHQSMADECNVNKIMAKFERDGVLSHVAQYEGNYGDFTGAMDYHAALNQVIQAGEMFMSLPASVRREFENDPGLFLDFCEDPENEDAMREMGLLPPKAAEDPAPEPKPKKVASNMAGTPKAPEEPKNEPEGE